MEVYLLEKFEVEDLRYALHEALKSGREVRIACPHGGGLAFKVGQGMWSPPLGRSERQLAVEAMAAEAIERLRSRGIDPQDHTAFDAAMSEAAEARALEGHTEGDV